MSMSFEDMVRCNHCMKVFHQNEIIYDEGKDKELSPYSQIGQLFHYGLFLLFSILNGKLLTSFTMFFHFGLLQRLLILLILCGLNLFFRCIGIY